jgi:hypothetical protein
MAWTFCPKCGVRTEWASSCSQCSAEIPVYVRFHSPNDDVKSPDQSGAAQYHAVGSQKKVAESPGYRENTEVQRSAWERRLFRIAALAVLAAAFLGILAILAHIVMP